MHCLVLCLHAVRQRPQRELVNEPPVGPESTRASENGRTPRTSQVTGTPQRQRRLSRTPESESDGSPPLPTTPREDGRSANSPDLSGREDPDHRGVMGDDDAGRALDGEENVRTAVESSAASGTNTERSPNSNVDTTLGESSRPTHDGSLRQVSYASNSRFTPARLALGSGVYLQGPHDFPGASHGSALMVSPSHAFTGNAPYPLEAPGGPMGGCPAMYGLAGAPSMVPGPQPPGAVWQWFRPAVGGSVNSVHGLGWQPAPPAPLAGAPAINHDGGVISAGTAPPATERSPLRSSTSAPERPRFASDEGQPDLSEDEEERDDGDAFTVRTHTGASGGRESRPSTC